MSVFEKFAEDEPGALHIRLDRELQSRLRAVQEEAGRRGLQLGVEKALLGHLRDLLTAAEAELGSAAPTAGAESRDGRRVLPSGEDVLTN